MYMNKQESDILNALLVEPFINQRILAVQKIPVNAIKLIVR